MLGASRFEKKHNARKAAWFTTATVIGAISAFVDRIDSHIILPMIRESKTRLIKYEGIEAPAERPQLIYNAKFQFKFYIDRL